MKMKQEKTQPVPAGCSPNAEDLSENTHMTLRRSFIISPRSNPTVSSEQYAITYFLDTYISGSHFDYVPQVYATARLESPFSAALHANACAHLSRETRDALLSAKAQQYYLNALAQTHAAIRSPEEAVLDSTIASVLLLGLYETLTQGHRRCPKSFIAHNNGAAALLKLRGETQFSTNLGKRIYTQVSLNMRVTCIDRNVELPRDFVVIDKLAVAHFGEDDFLTRFLPILDGFNNLRIAAAEEVERSDITDVTIEKALKLDQVLTEVMHKLSDRLKFETIGLDHDDGTVLDGSYHKYSDHRAAQRWNAVRMIRLVLNEHIWEHISRMEPSTSSRARCTTSMFLLQELASRNVEDMARQICASVPQFGKKGPNGLWLITPVLFLLWPLAVAGNSRLTPPIVRAYIVDRLRYIGREAQLVQSTWAADMIQEGKMMEDWLHLSHLA
jgi:hypothetical protein